MFAALALALPIIASSAVTLPDYTKIKPVDEMACDNETTSYVAYQTDVFELVVITTKQGNTLYNFADKSGRYFMYKAAGSGVMTDLSKAEANAMLKEFSPNFYNLIFKTGPSDCKE